MPRYNATLRLTVLARLTLLSIVTIAHYSVCRAEGERMLDCGHVHVISQENAGTLWIGAAKGLFQVSGRDHKTRRVQAAMDEVYCIHKQKNGTLWFGSTSGLFRKAQDEDRVAPVDELKKDIAKIFEDRQGIIWIVTMNEGLFCKRNADLPFELANEKVNTVHRFFQDSSDTFWIGAESGLFRKRVGDRVPLQVQGFQSAGAFYEDANGRFWIGAGILREKKPKDDDLIVADARIKTPISFYEDKKGTLWIGARSGLFRQNKIHKDFNRVDVAINGPCHFFEDKASSLWIASEENVFLQKPGDAVPKVVAPNVCVYCITEHSGGSLWFGAEDRVLCKDVGSNTLRRVDLETGETSLRGQRRCSVARYEKGPVPCHAQGR